MEVERRKVADLKTGMVIIEDGGDESKTVRILRFVKGRQGRIHLVTTGRSKTLRLTDSLLVRS